jgi:hypothetical protein
VPDEVVLVLLRDDQAKCIEIVDSYDIPEAIVQI